MRINTLIIFSLEKFQKKGTRCLFITKIEFDSGSSVIVLDVSIENNGVKKKVRMALDTGATFLMIPWEVAESLKLKPELSKERIETITASGIEIVPVIELPTVTVGNSKAKKVKAIVHDLPAKSRVDGLLGLSFLKNFSIKINFMEGFLELE